MDISNHEVAEALKTTAFLLEIENANPFRIRAYRNAAQVLEDLPQPVTELVAQNENLADYSGIGKDLAEKIKTYVETGHFTLLDELTKKHPPTLRELTKLPNLGPKKVRLLHEKLGIASIKDLQTAIKQELIREVPGFGVTTENKIKEDLEKFLQRGESRRFLWSEVDLIARQLLDYLNESQEIQQCVLAGSYRRRKETVGDLDILVTGQKPKKMMDHFVAYQEVQKILSQGATRSTVILKNGLQVDLRVLKEESFGSGLYYFTGSKAHNIEVRKLARQEGLKINEYGVFKGKKKIVSNSEEEIFEVMGMDYIHPEMRENRGEIAAAREHRLPELITLDDIQGDLHSHTIATDGRNTIEEMALKAKKLGLKYLAVTDHSQNLKVAGGLDVKRLKKHIEAIDEINAKIKGIKILKGIEVDILENGSLDLPDSILKELDIRVCSIHMRFKMSAEAMTERIIRAMDNRYFNILGHPTGRLILKRDPFEFDFERVVQASVERGKFLEINCQPNRLDLNAEHCQLAQELGAKFVISTDAHSNSGLDNMHLGVAQARRGWVEKKNVVNALSWKELKALL
jgi:DNA polymerase (family X)